MAELTIDCDDLSPAGKALCLAAANSVLAAAGYTIGDVLAAKERMEAFRSNPSMAASVEMEDHEALAALGLAEIAARSEHPDPAHCRLALVVTH